MEELQESSSRKSDLEKSNLVKAQVQAEQEAKTILNREKRRFEKHQKEQKRELQLLNPNIEKNVIEWCRKKGEQNTFEGLIEDDVWFEIKPGILTFSLRIKNIDLLEYHKENKKSINTNGIELFVLQKKANKILLEFISRSQKF